MHGKIIEEDLYLPGSRTSTSYPELGGAAPSTTNVSGYKSHGIKEIDSISTPSTPTESEYDVTDSTGADTNTTPATSTSARSDSSVMDLGELTPTAEGMDEKTHVAERSRRAMSSPTPYLASPDTPKPARTMAARNMSLPQPIQAPPVSPITHRPHESKLGIPSSASVAISRREMTKQWDKREHRRAEPLDDSIATVKLSSDNHLKEVMPAAVLIQRAAKNSQGDATTLANQVSTLTLNPKALYHPSPGPLQDPRDHSLLHMIYKEMHVARFINLNPLALLPNLMTLYFESTS